MYLFFLRIKKNLFIYVFLFGCVGSLLLCAGFSLQWLLLLWSTGSRRAGFNSCGTQAQQLWHMGLVALRHVGSLWTRARTCVPCIGRWILSHCATREALYFFQSCFTLHLLIYILKDITFPSMHFVILIKNSIPKE